MVMRDLLDAGCAVKVSGSATGSSDSSDGLPPRTPSIGSATPRPRVSDPKGQLTGTPSLRVSFLRLVVYFRFK